MCERGKGRGKEREKESGRWLEEKWRGNNGCIYEAEKEALGGGREMK